MPNDRTRTTLPAINGRQPRPPSTEPPALEPAAARSLLRELGQAIARPIVNAIGRFWLIAFLVGLVAGAAAAAAMVVYTALN